MSEYTQTISPTDGAYIHRPDGEKVPLVQAVYELNALLARAEKAEAALVAKQNSGSDGPIDWQRVKIDAAIAAMQGILAGNLYREPLSSDGWPEQRAAFLAIDYAGMLTEELKKEVAE